MKSVRRNHKKTPKSNDRLDTTSPEIEHDYFDDWNYRELGQSAIIAGWRQYIKERRMATAAQK